MEVRFSGLQADLGGFAGALFRWSAEGRRDLRMAFINIGERFKTEAKKRVPVDEGRLRNAIMSNTYEESTGDLVTEVGTNVEYGIYVEFGTKWIAGGAVKRIGLKEEVTDAEAVHWWKEKAGGALRFDKSRPDSAGYKMDKISIGFRGGVLVTAGGEAANGPQEQMPWLRAAWSSIKDWSRERINNAMRPPEQRN